LGGTVTAGMSMNTLGQIENHYFFLLKKL